MNTDPNPGAVPQSRSRILVFEPVTPLSRHLIDLIDEAVELQSCGAVATLEEALHALRTRRPDLVIVGASLKPRNALKAVGELRSAQPELKLLVLSGSHSPACANQFLLAGANGFAALEDLDDLADAVLDVLAGALFVSEEVSWSGVHAPKDPVPSQLESGLLNPGLQAVSAPAAHCPA